MLTNFLAYIIAYNNMKLAIKNNLKRETLYKSAVGHKKRRQ